MLPRSPNRYDRPVALAAIIFTSFALFSVGPWCSQVLSVNKSFRKNRSCFERKDLLRDNHGRPVRMSSSELTDRVIERQPIERPGTLGRNNLRGVVTIQVVIDKQGRVICAYGVAGHPIAFGPAIKSLQKWTFRPYSVNGKRKAVVGVLDIPYDFGS
jgi:Gram-negative bacterial TonB protein C-terminal